MWKPSHVERAAAAAAEAADDPGPASGALGAVSSASVSSGLEMIVAGDEGEKERDSATQRRRARRRSKTDAAAGRRYVRNLKPYRTVKMHDRRQ